jgi:heme-degrading monooxygenase HmoA
MIAIMFEVYPEDGRADDYFAIAKSLRDDLDQVDGFISVERFQSISDPNKYLSLSFFRDDEAVQRWRNLATHRKAQAAGRSGVFRDYRLRVGSVVRDYGMFERTQAPTDSVAMHS